MWILVTHAGLLESEPVTIGERHTWFGRIEVVGKPGHDLHVHEAPADVFGVSKATGRLRALLQTLEEHRLRGWRDGLNQHRALGARTAVFGTGRAWVRRLPYGSALTPHDVGDQLLNVSTRVAVANGSRRSLGTSERPATFKRVEKAGPNAFEPETIGPAG